MRSLHGGGGRESPPADPPDDSDRAGLVVIRVWLERGEGAAGLRARISLVHDLERGETALAFASTVDEIVETVSEFVAEFVAGPPGAR